MKNNILLFGYLGLMASFFVGIGEFMVHFTPIPINLSEPYSYFLHIPEKRLIRGHFIMIPFIPLYIFGYWHIYLALKPGNHKLAKAVLVLGIFSFMIGGMWVASRANLGFLIQTKAKALALGEPISGYEQLIIKYELLLETLVQLLRIFILAISVLFIWAIIKGGTLYPKWMVIFAPALLLGVVFFLFFYVNGIGKYLAPTAMNVTHFILFSTSLLALRTQLKKQTR